MRVKLTMFASGGMGATTGDSGVTMDLPEDSVLEDLVEVFLKQYGKELIGGSDEYQRRFFSRYISLSVNAELVSHENRREVVLHDGDSVTIIPIITGG
jgi:molybdopterin converting factor small subunit